MKAVDWNPFRMVVLIYGRLAQLERALVSGTRGRAFESRIARQSKIIW